MIPDAICLDGQRTDWKAVAAKPAVLHACWRTWLTVINVVMLRCFSFVHFLVAQSIGKG
jgi:hypothetical protein